MSADQALGRLANLLQQAVLGKSCKHCGLAFEPFRLEEALG
jgi:hypothetical protein